MYIRQANYEKLRRTAARDGKSIGAIINELVESNGETEGAEPSAASRKGALKFCMDCAYFHGDLTAQDVMLLNRMLEKYDAQVMLKSWMELGQVKKPSGRSGLDQDKVKCVEILKRKVYCWREKAFVLPVDVACYAWQPKP